MPRQFYKTVIGLLFALLSLGIVAVEVIVILWLLDHMGNPLTWVAFILLGFVDVGLLNALFEYAKKRIERA